MEAEQIQRVIQYGKKYEIVWQNHPTQRVNENTFVRHALLKGRTYTAAEFLRLQEQLVEEAAYESALYYIEHRLRTIQEVQQMLIEKGYERKVSQNVIRRLCTQKLLDDTYYSQCYVRTKKREGKSGRQKIIRELKEKGIILDEEALSEDYSLAEEQKNCDKQAQRWQQRYAKSSCQEQKQKIRQKLFQQGFPEAAIQESLHQLQWEEEKEIQKIQQVGEKYWRKYARYPFYERKQKTYQALYRKGFRGETIRTFLVAKEGEADVD